MGCGAERQMGTEQKWGMRHAGEFTDAQKKKCIFWDKRGQWMHGHGREYVYICKYFVPHILIITKNSRGKEIVLTSMKRRCIKI